MPASAGEDSIGLYADESATLCTGALIPFQIVSVYVIACLDDLDAIIAAELAIAGYPGSPGYPLGQCTPQWSSPLVIGSLTDDFALAYSEPRSGPRVLLGRLDFLAYSAGWPGPDHLLRVVPGSARDEVILVDDAAIEHDVTGGHFTLNCSGTCDCGPPGAASISISQVKQLY